MPDFPQLNSLTHTFKQSGNSAPLKYTERASKQKLVMVSCEVESAVGLEELTLTC